MECCLHNAHQFHKATNSAQTQASLCEQGTVPGTTSVLRSEYYQTEASLFCLVTEFSCNLRIHIAAQIPAMKSGWAVDGLCTLAIALNTFIFHTPRTLEHAERCWKGMAQKFWVPLQHIDLIGNHNHFLSITTLHMGKC